MPLYARNRDSLGANKERECDSEVLIRRIRSGQELSSTFHQILRALLLMLFLRD